MKNVRSLAVSEALTENNYAVNRLLRGGDLAALSKGRLRDPFKREIRALARHFLGESREEQKDHMPRLAGLTEGSGPGTCRQENEGRAWPSR